MKQGEVILTREKFLKNLEYVSDKEMEEIETSYGSPDKKVFYSEEIDL